MDKHLEDLIKENFINQWVEQLVQMDENSAAFEFNELLELNEFIAVLETFYSDYQVRICRTSGHPTIQVHMRLEGGLWKAK
jgi:hypothetical protein